MLSKTSVLVRASFLQLRIYLLCIFSVVALSFLTNFILTLSLDSSGENVQVSPANLLATFLIFMAIVLPVSFFKRMINLGATRKEYYTGLLVIYTIWSAVFALFNIVWFNIELGTIRYYQNTFNILEIFHWDQFGVAGMFVYQFGAYMLLVSLLNLLFCGLRHYAGWVLWVVLIAAIPIGTSIPSLRHYVVDGFLALLFNDSLLQGFGLTLVLSIVFLAGGWWFTSRRSF